VWPEKKGGGVFSSKSCPAPNSMFLDVRVCNRWCAFSKKATSKGAYTCSYQRKIILKLRKKRSEEKSLDKINCLQCKSAKV